MVTLPKKVKTSPSRFSTNTILDKHGTPNLADVFFPNGTSMTPGIYLFGDPNWQQARRSPKQSHHLRRHRRPGETVLWYGPKSCAIKGHGWLDLMVKAPTKTTSNLLWKTILVHFGMASLQGPRLLHRSHCHVGGLLFNIPKQCNTLRFTGNPLDRKQSQSPKSTLFLAALG